MSVSALFIYGTIFDRKRTHFVYLPLTDGTPFTNLHISEKNSPSYLVSGTTFRNYIVLNLKEQFLCYINLVLDLLRWAGWVNSLNKAFQKIAPWLTSLELKFPLNCFECTVFYFLDFFKAIKSFCSHFYVLLQTEMTDFLRRRPRLLRLQWFTAERTTTDLGNFTWLATTGNQTTKEGVVPQRNKRAKQLQK